LNSQTPNPNNHTKPNIASHSSKIFIKFHQELSSKGKHSQHAIHENLYIPTKYTPLHHVWELKFHNINPLTYQHIMQTIWDFRNKTAACVKLQKLCIYIQIKDD